MKKGDKVHWNWGKSQAEGTITQKSEKTITKKIKGKEVKRNASKEEPAYVIEQQNGTEVVKSESELKEGEKDK
jgi:Hypervirulence associated proteins TUDOR domain